MSITLTSDITVRLVQKVGGDAMVCAAAKVSTSGAEAETLTDAEANAGLIRFLMRHRHGTPFEHASLTFFVHAPIFVWRQWHRHRVMSFNEESGRYKKLEPTFWVPRLDRPMINNADHRPSKPSFVAAHHDEAEMILEALETSYYSSWHIYESLLKLDVCNEVARVVLPTAIYSSCWVTCNPRSLMAFLSLRTHEAAATFQSYPQAEIEEAARAAESIFAEGWPLTYEAFVRNGRVGP